MKNLLILFVLLTGCKKPQYYAYRFEAWYQHSNEVSASFYIQRDPLSWEEMEKTAILHEVADSMLAYSDGQWHLLEKKCFTEFLGGETTFREKQLRSMCVWVDTEQREWYTYLVSNCQDTLSFTAKHPLHWDEMESLAKMHNSVEVTEIARKPTRKLNLEPCN